MLLSEMLVSRLRVSFEAAGVVVGGAAPVGVRHAGEPAVVDAARYEGIGVLQLRKKSCIKLYPCE